MELRSSYFSCQKLGNPEIQGQLLGKCLSTAAAGIGTGYMQVCKFSTGAVSCWSDSFGTWEQGAAAAPPVLGHWTGKPFTNTTSFLHANSFSCWSLLFLPVPDAGTLYFQTLPVHICCLSHCCGLRANILGSLVPKLVLMSLRLFKQWCDINREELLLCTTSTWE